MLVHPVGLRKIPARALRLIVAAATENSGAGVFVAEFVRRPQIPSLLGDWNSVQVWTIAPGIHPSVVALGCILPLPFMGKPLAGPGGIRPCVLERDPSYGLAGPSVRVAAILPILQEIVVVRGMVARGVDEFLEFRIGHRIAIHIERLDRHDGLVVPPRRVLPRVLYIDADFVRSLNLDARDLEVEIRREHFLHPGGSGRGGPGRRNIYHSLLQESALLRETFEPHSTELVHLAQELLEFFIHGGGWKR